MPNLLARRRSPDQSQHGVSKPNAFGLPHTAASPSEQSLALRLSDAQLDEIMRLCQPLALKCRDALLRILAHELRGRRDVGDGELHRIARTIIRENHLFDPPDLDGRMSLAFTRPVMRSIEPHTEPVKSTRTSLILSIWATSASVRAPYAKPVTLPLGRLTSSPMLVTGRGFLSMKSNALVTVPSQDRVRTAVSAACTPYPDRSTASRTIGTRNAMWLSAQKLVG